MKLLHERTIQKCDGGGLVTREEKVPTKVHYGVGHHTQLLKWGTFWEAWWNELRSGHSQPWETPGQEWAAATPTLLGYPHEEEWGLCRTSCLICGRTMRIPCGAPDVSLTPKRDGLHLQVCHRTCIWLGAVKWITQLLLGILVIIGQTDRFIITNFTKICDFIGKE